VPCTRKRVEVQVLPLLLYAFFPLA
jgi:hypothetical protein